MALVCVLGANGFIGRNSLAALRNAGFRVRAAVRRREQLQEAVAADELCDVEVVEADITKPATLAACVEGCDIVVNCAGIYKWWLPNAEEYLRVNDVGAGNVGSACLAAGVRRLIHYSTPMSYGYPRDKPFTEMSEAGAHASEYARTKRLGDLRIKDLCRGKPIETVILHLGCTIGAGDTDSAGRIAAVVKDHIRGKIPMLVGADTNYIYVHIADVRQAIVRAAQASAEKVAGEDFFIANSDDMMTTRHFFDLIGKHTEKPPPRSSLNLTVGSWFANMATWVATHVTGSEPTAPADILRTAKFGSIEYSCQKSKDVLGMEYTPIDLAVAESVADVKSRMAQGSARL
eukprot:TRINITY_DN73316_c0_g1_i1.p1 TRINITY_DN73316_c0_g1~~TRINITY_DN73316_c0_g1_i1.p1  ORF type:complete len:346 (+),score=70.76 TRINITY_DN73316_c0_g1_i1:153-1190(+)